MPRTIRNSMAFMLGLMTLALAHWASENTAPPGGARTAALDSNDLQSGAREPTDRATAAPGVADAPDAIKSDAVENVAGAAGADDAGADDAGANDADDDAARGDLADGVGIADGVDIADGVGAESGGETVDDAVADTANVSAEAPAISVAPAQPDQAASTDAVADASVSDASVTDASLVVAAVEADAPALAEVPSAGGGDAARRRAATDEAVAPQADDLIAVPDPQSLLQQDAGLDQDIASARDEAAETPAQSGDAGVEEGAGDLLDVAPSAATLRRDAILAASEVVSNNPLTDDIAAGEIEALVDKEAPANAQDTPASLDASDDEIAESAEQNLVVADIIPLTEDIATVDANASTAAQAVAPSLAPSGDAAGGAVADSDIIDSDITDSDGAGAVEATAPPVFIAADRIEIADRKRRIIASGWSDTQGAFVAERGAPSEGALKFPYRIMPFEWIRSSDPAAYPETCLPGAGARETVTVRFRVTELGRPERLAVASASNECFTRAARRTVSNMRFHVKAPAGFGLGGSFFLVSVVFDRPASES